MGENTITVEQLQDKLNKREPVFILDVRPADERQEWRIAESTHIDAYKRLREGDNTALDAVDFPQDATIVTVCAAGRTSLLASKLLGTKGIKAYSLEGGMKAWNYAWNTSELNIKDGKVIQVRRPAKGVLSYVVGSGEEAVVIDAALHPAVYQTIAQENGWKIKYAIDTHIHADYVSRTRELARLTGARHLLIDKADVDFDRISVPHGASVSFGNQTIEFIHTPGHTWESTTLKLGSAAIFTGDTIFVDGIGRPDLKANGEEAIERAKALYASLRVILALDPELFVLPAHTSDAISFDNKLIGKELKHVKKHVSVADSAPADFVDYALSRIPPTPPNYLTIAAINRKGSYEGEVLADLEAGGNHCAIA